MKTAIVRSAMHEGVIRCSPQTSVKEAARLMAESGIRALVVTDGECGLVGIVSQTDLVNATLVRPGAPPWAAARVSDVMTADVVRVPPDLPLQDAARLMIDRRIHRVVVVDESGGACLPVGMLSMGDIVRDLIKDQDGDQ